MRCRLVTLFGSLGLFNALAWVWAGIAFHGHPLLLNLAFLAFSLGLRHAVDADHIAAIDNATRTLMRTGQRPVSAGLLFALGHSTIVVLACVGLAATASTLQRNFSQFRQIGEVAGTIISTLFLFAIALLNIWILRGVYRQFTTVRRGGVIDDLHARVPARQGVLTRILRPLFRLVTRPWHLYLLGLVFGLGFDTASEIGVLSVSASQASKGLPIGSIMVFPLLFTAGMALIDTLDGTLVVGAYGWAIKPIRRLYYNMTMTLISILIAVVVGGIESLGLLARSVGLRGPAWDMIRAANENFNALGYGAVGLFVVTWLLAVAVYHLKGFDRLKQPLARA